ncbi:MAG: glycosyltransferase family 1 protein, partial [Thermoprotei archaeon]
TWRRYLMVLVRELKLEDSVRFLGYVSDEDLKALYVRANVVLLPSKMEGFGLTTIEGWNYRKPVVVSRGAGSSELVIEDVNGYTHRPEDHEELSEKLEKVLSNTEKAEKMGSLGYETSKQCWVSSAVEKLKEVFEEILETYRAAH